MKVQTVAIARLLEQDISHSPWSYIWRNGIRTCNLPIPRPSPYPFSWLGCNQSELSQYVTSRQSHIYVFQNSFSSTMVKTENTTAWQFAWQFNKHKGSNLSVLFFFFFWVKTATQLPTPWKVLDFHSLFCRSLDKVISGWLSFKRGHAASAKLH